jgi:2-deoxy-D-gluconate 3-dehydrogenase
MKNLNELLNLSGQTAIVTGGSRGIGLGIAHRLAEAGASVVIGALKDEEMQAAIAEISSKGGKVKGVKVDVSKEDEVKNMVNFAVENFGSVDILVNNAGIFPAVPVAEMSKENFEKVIAVNLEGVFLCTKYAAEQMIKQGKGGKVINITSIDALHPSMVGLAHYDSSKHAVWGFTKNSALEFAPHKIWINAIAPGAIATPGVQEMQKPDVNQKAADAAKNIEAMLNKIPMKRMGEADDIGKVALFLASDMSSYMTGEQIVVDGGVLLS